MLDFKKSVYENIFSIKPKDPLYDCLPRLVEGTENEIYTVQRIPPRTINSMKDGKPLKIEVSPAILRVFLIFDINNKLYEDCITKGRCMIHKYDTMVVVYMDENYHMDAYVEFYLDLPTPIQNYIQETQQVVSGTDGYPSIDSDYTFLSYGYLFDHNQTSSSIDKQISDQALLGGPITKEVTFYDEKDHVRKTVLQKVVEDGLLSKIDDRFIHYAK